MLWLANGDVVELGGGEEKTTNNRMELQAALEALHFLDTQVRVPIVLYTDSKYLINGITQWIEDWKRRGWLTAGKKPVLNQDLWSSLDQARRGLSIQWTYVPGHAGIPGNERADAIAVSFSKDRPIDLYAGPHADAPVIVTIPTDAQRTAASGGSKKRKGKPIGYLSLVGGELMRHDTWSECQRRVEGVFRARYRKFFDAHEAQEIARSWGVSPIE